MKKLMTAAVVLGIGAMAAHASDWTGAVDTDWFTAGNWTVGVPAGDNTGINDISLNTPLITANAAVNDLFLGTGANTGALNQNAGTLSAAWSFVGVDPGSSGTYNLTGSGSATGLRMMIGQAGGIGSVTVDTTGSLDMNGSAGWYDIWTENSIVIGNDGLNSGTLNVVNGTVNAVGLPIWVGGFAGSGALNQTGGEINTAGLVIQKFWGTAAAGSSVSVGNGTLNSDWIDISASGAATDVMGDNTLTVNSGGVVNSAGDVRIVGGDTGSSGTITVNSGGQLNVGTGGAEKWMILGQYDVVDSELNVNSGGTLNLLNGSDIVNGASSGSHVINVEGTIQGTAGSRLDLGSAAGVLNIIGGGLVDIETIVTRGQINGDLSLGAGSMLQIADFADSLVISGAVSLDNTFGVDDLVADWNVAVEGTYILINNASDFSNIENWGFANRVTVRGDGLQAYFETGSLALVVVPEPSTFALAGMAMAGLLIFRRRS